MSYPYREVFERIEESFFNYGMRHKTREQIEAALDNFRHRHEQRLSDEQYFAYLRDVVFYSGMRAATVSSKMDRIRHWFPDCQTASKCNGETVASIMSDKDMIKNKLKVSAVIKNAQTFGDIVECHGSMQRYIDSFSAMESFENLLLLKEELQDRFAFLGGVTVYHFLTEIGMPVLKPDRVICRIFHRLGLIESERQFLRSVIHGRKFAEATGHSVRYIDIILVAYGQSASEYLGIDRGICLSQPRCELCEATEHCEWFRENAKKEKR